MPNATGEHVIGDREPGSGGGTVASACNWTQRCTAPGEHDVWTAAIGQLVTRRVCEGHLRVAIAISYRLGEPPERLA